METLEMQSENSLILDVLQSKLHDMKMRIYTDSRFHVVADTDEKIEYYHLPSGRLCRVELSGDWTFRTIRHGERDSFLFADEAGLDTKRKWLPFVPVVHLGE